MAKKDRQQNKQQTRNVQNTGTTDQFALAFFSVVLAAVFGLCMYLFFVWSKRPPENLPPPPDILPPLEDVIQNIKLIFQGYHNGYLRTIIGYSVFGMMSAFFLSAGKVVLDFIFGIKGQEVKGLTKEMNVMERIALYYILGSLVGSLLWLGLGVMGFLNIQVALGVGIIGCLLFLFQIVRYKAVNTIKEGLSSWKNQWGLTEKVMSIVLVIILLLWSTTAVPFQTYSDVYQIHLPLPTIYIHDDRMMFNPYMIYSYFPQNTEMLVMWALLFKSEVAAALLIWGFLVSLVLLLWGYVRRYADNLVAIMTVFLLISAPVVCWFSTAIKNDLPVGVLLFAHYVALVEAINKQSEEVESSKHWAILSGIFCGGAVGHKLTAMIPALISVLLLIGYGLFRYVKNKEKKEFKLTLFWLMSFIVMVTPWFLRTCIATGNPIYPYLNKLFGGHLVKPWHVSAQASTSIASEGWNGLAKYFHLLVGTYKENNLILAPNWGPMILFGLLSLYCIWKNVSLGVRMALLASLLSWIAHLFYSLEVRYQIGMIMFIVCVPVAFFSGSNLGTSYLRNKTIKVLSLTLILMCFIQNIINSKMSNVIRQSTTLLFSGFSPGNFNLTFGDEQINDLRWMGHIVNTRTQKDETVLFAGVSYGYGVDRKIFFGVDPDKQMLIEMAENSSDTVDLWGNLRKLGINHILLNPGLIESYKSSVRPELKIKENDAKKIEDLFRNYMNVRFATQNGKIIWYSFKDCNNQQMILLNENDVREFPLVVINKAHSLFSLGENEIARNMLEAIINVPMDRVNKIFAYAILGNAYIKKGEIEKAERANVEAIKIAPSRPEPYINLASFYEVTGGKSKVKNLVDQGIKLGGGAMVRNNPLLAKYLSN